MLTGALKYLLETNGVQGKSSELVEKLVRPIKNPTTNGDYLFKAAFKCVSHTCRAALADSASCLDSYGLFFQGAPRPSPK